MKMKTPQEFAEQIKYLAKLKAQLYQHNYNVSLRLQQAYAMGASSEEREMLCHEALNVADITAILAHELKRLDRPEPSGDPDRWMLELDAKSGRGSVKR